MKNLLVTAQSTAGKTGGQAGGWAAGRAVQKGRLRAKNGTHNC